MKKNNSKEGIIPLSKILICTIIFLSLAILSKSNSTYKEKIYNYIYEKNINFTYFKNIYNKYLGGITHQDTNTKETTVFNESLTYTNIEKYENGAKLTVENNYLIPNQSKGIVTFIGTKEKYGSVIIIEDENNLETWYGNICNSNLKIYDNIDKESYIGQSCSNYIYIVFFKENNFIDYKKYLS